MIKIHNFFSKAFIILGLSGGFSGVITQNLQASNEKKRAFIVFIQEIFPDNKYVQRVFAQDLDMVGIEKSPFEQEIMNWSQKRKTVIKKRRKEGRALGYKSTTMETEEIFKALILKAMINFFDAENENLEEEPCLDFNTTNVNKDLLDAENEKNFCLFMHAELYPFKFFSDFLENRKKIINKEERIHYFFQNFNAFIRNYKTVNFNFLHINNLFESHLKFITFSSFGNFPLFFNYLNTFKETCEELFNTEKEITDHFSDNFFKQFNQRIFSHFSDIEYIFFWNYFFNETDSKLYNIGRTFDYMLSSIYLNFEKSIFKNTFNITIDNLEKILNTILISLKGFFFYRHTVRLYTSIFSLKDIQNIDESTDYVVNYLKNEEYQEIKYLVIQDVENIYIKKALEAAYKIFFISFMKEDSIFKFLGKFKAVDYNSYLFKLRNKIKPFLTKKEMELHENAYTSKDVFNFVLCAKSQSKYSYNIPFFALKYFVGSDDFFDIFLKKDNRFFQKMEESLKPLSISLIQKCSYIRNLALERIEFLKKTIEKLEYKPIEKLEYKPKKTALKSFYF